MNEPFKLQGLVPDTLQIRQCKITLDQLEVMTDIGFHEYEVGAPQRLLVTVELWLDMALAPADDEPASAWNYDFLRDEVRRTASARRYNLQETLLQSLFDRFAACHGVTALRISSVKPDVYADAHGVGVEISSLAGPSD
ncbi:dihydroneopterin aldolase [Sphingomonas sp.]|uniref:dihydroneopterin aldolase n=1 Tax=Sphingomonas sp. TaxID=28214 RepID=UPI00286B57E7|nr:dihydroneopterin aldolase [Sphingomonas sp.]